MHLPTFDQQSKGLMEYLYKANAVLVRIGGVFSSSVGCFRRGAGARAASASSDRSCVSPDLG
jgi:hypothetical protein